MLDSHLIAKTRPQVRSENVVLFGDIRISVLADRLFRIEKDEKRKFCDEATEAVWFRDMPPVFFTAKETEDGIDIKTKRVTLSVKKNFEESFILIDGEKRPLNNEGNLLGTLSTLDRCDGDNYIESDNVTVRKIRLGEGVLSENGVAVLDYTKSSDEGWHDSKSKKRFNGYLCICLRARLQNRNPSVLHDLRKYSEDSAIRFR